MYRTVLMPELDDTSTSQKLWRRIFYSVVLTSVEFFLALIAIMAGVPVLIDPFSLSLISASLVKLLPGWVIILWGVQMVLGGSITIGGILKGDYRIEQIGVLFLIAGAFIYWVALLFALPGSWVPFITYFFFMFAMAARYWVLGKLIKLTGRLTTHFLRDST